jgi:phosphate transport system substrate-binding protein
MRSLRNFLVLFVLSSLFACNGGSIITTDTPTSGHTKIGSDESYQPMIEAQVDLFEAIYQYAVITPKYGPESDIVDLFLKDSLRVVVISRKLTDAEEKYLISNQFIPKTTKIAFDGLAFIVNKKNPDSLLRFDQVKDIFEGKINNWKQIDPKSELEGLDVIFDNNKSGNPRYIRERFKISGKFPENCFAVNSNEEVIKHVQRNPHALGIISVNWISDKHDSVANRFLQEIKVVGIGDEADLDGVGPFLKPYQAYIADGSYPFCRDVYIINRETYSGLGTGFAAFVAGEKGQRVILKAGLVPATMPVRLVHINNQ